MVVRAYVSIAMSRGVLSREPGFHNDIVKDETQWKVVFGSCMRMQHVGEVKKCQL